VWKFHAIYFCRHTFSGLHLRQKRNVTMQQFFFPGLRNRRMQKNDRIEQSSSTYQASVRGESVGNTLKELK